MNNYFRFCDLKHGEMILCIMMYRQSLTIFAAVVLSLWVDSQQLCKETPSIWKLVWGKHLMGSKYGYSRWHHKHCIFHACFLDSIFFFSCHAISPNETLIVPEHLCEIGFVKAGVFFSRFQKIDQNANEIAIFDKKLQLMIHRHLLP